jgi:hypothetical protein
MRRAVGIVLLALVLGLTAACGGKDHGRGVASAHGGGGGASPSPTASVDPEEAKRQFAQCMREHGVDLPDPGSGGGGVHVQRSGDPNSDTAMKACQKYLPPDAVTTPDAQTIEKIREFTQCMREHGIDVPDPDPNGAGSVMNKEGGPNPDDPAFKAAQEACKDKLPGNVVTQTGGPK